MPSSLPVAEMLTPITGDKPCGETNPSIEAVLGAVDDLIKGKPPVIKLIKGKREVVEDGEDPDWQTLEKLAYALFRNDRLPSITSDASQSSSPPIGQIKHLKCTILLTITGLVLEGLEGFADGLMLIQKLLENYWEDLYPHADREDPDDPYLQRVILLNPLSLFPIGGITVRPGTDSWGFFKQLLNAKLVESPRYGTLYVKDLLSQRAESIQLAMPPDIEPSNIDANAAIIDSAESAKNCISIMDTILESIKGIREAFESAEGDIKPDLYPLEQTVVAIRTSLDPSFDVVGDPGPEGGSGVITEYPLEEDDELPEEGGTMQHISSRKQAVAKLAEIASFFEQTEPSSPISAMLKRTQKLAGMDFLSLVEELQLGKEAVQSYQKLTGSDRDDNS